MRDLAIAALIIVPGLVIPGSAAAWAAGGATYTPGTDSHLDMQHQIGAKTYVDCGRSSEADLRMLESTDGTWKPSADVAALIGTTIPEFADDLQWVDGHRLTMKDSRGHPVFVRFWYRNCDMCIASAPLMNELYDQYSKDGLIVIGIHHAKTTNGDTIEQVKRASDDLDYKFPIAIDNSWNTVGRFWIHSKARPYSSVSFLVDRNGVIVWAHDLGRLEKGTPAALSLHEAIRKQFAVSAVKEKH